MELAEIPLAQTPFYADLIKSMDFVDTLKRRYKELASGSISANRLIDLIDSTVEYLGPAQARDWARWEYRYQYDPLTSLEPYSTGGSEPARLRQTKSYEQEITKMKYVLREHSLQIAEAIPLLYSEKGMITKADNYERNTRLFVVFFAVFMLAIAFAKRQNLK